VKKPMPLAYGPIDSRRFGRSLGVNPLGSEKICSFDCGYCDLGHSSMTMNRIRKELVFPSRATIMDEVRAELRKDCDMEAITFSGNGEPTLYPEFEELVTEVKQARGELAPKAKLIVLSNGAHLDSKKVVAGMNLLDVRVIKLDAGSDRLLKTVNAPLVRRNLSQLLTGIKKLDNCTIQGMFVQGSINNISSAEIDEWVEVIGMIKPIGVQLMTVTRPTADKGILPVEEDVLYSIAFKLKKRIQIEARVFAGPTNPKASAL
jgi:wyosine [tRNA(Phe)-imidazoG37] synthetase (radical SAM superfamily)